MVFGVKVCVVDISEFCMVWVVENLKCMKFEVEFVVGDVLVEEG